LLEHMWKRLHRQRCRRGFSASKTPPCPKRKRSQWGGSNPRPTGYATFGEPPETTTKRQKTPLFIGFSAFPSIYSRSAVKNHSGTLFRQLSVKQPGTLVAGLTRRGRFPPCSMAKKKKAGAHPDATKRGHGPKQGRLGKGPGQALPMEWPCYGFCFNWSALDL
jgi:hypothetical protein